VFFRILIWSILLFFIVRFIWKIVSRFLDPAPPGQQSTKVSEPPPKPSEEFKDVRDAKFVDVPKSAADDSDRDENT